VSGEPREGAGARGDRPPDPAEPREPVAPPAAGLPDSLDALGRTSDSEVWEALARWRAERRRFALATVVESRGFTPRKPGAHMLIAEDGATVGTVGGGAIEREVMEQARAALGRGEPTLLRRDLTQELGMCCGGEMSVFLEVLEPAPRLFLFGAGYIAKPLAAIAAGCGFEVMVADERPEWATGERFPTSRVRVESAEDVARTLEPDRRDCAVVVTHDHALDQRVVQHLLRKPLRFVGMIGSVSKQRKFALRLRARGFSDEEIARLHTPLGVAIGATTPEEIAVSAMAQLIAVRRGGAVGPGWVPPAPRAARDAKAATEEVGRGSSAEERAAAEAEANEADAGADPGRTGR
jgi:xanthine dehydrogenase accessory factor